MHAKLQLIEPSLASRLPLATVPVGAGRSWPCLNCQDVLLSIVKPVTDAGMRNRRRAASSLKSRLTEADEPLLDAANRAVWSQAVRYTGNPDHKRNPGDFGLTPPASPRRHASLCDDANITTRATALALLRSGIKQGLVSEQMRGSYPAQIWAVGNDGVVFEARLENEVRGEYHGYPIPLDDPLRLVLLLRVGRLSHV